MRARGWVTARGSDARAGASGRHGGTTARVRARGDARGGTVRERGVVRVVGEGW